MATTTAAQRATHAHRGPSSSGMMGTISGSGVANVLTVGQFTIPLMKRFGYSPVFAGAVEATASMGGQIMPPVMGAVAFIMAETLNVPYVTIVKAAVDPGVPLLLHRVLDGPPRGRPREPARPAEGPVPEPVEGAAARAGTWCCRWRCWSTCCSTASRRCSPASSGLALTAILILGAAIAGAHLGRPRSATRSGSPRHRRRRPSSSWGIEPVLVLIAALVARLLRASRAGARRSRLCAQPDRRRQAGAERRHRLRDRRRHHRRPDADRRGVELRRLHARRSARRACSCRWC